MLFRSKLQYFDSEQNLSYVPYVVETAIGLDRMFLSVLSASYTEEKLEDGSERTVLRIPAQLAPVKLAILPLVKKDGLDDKAKKIYQQLKLDFNCHYDEKDAIGRRYRRQDAIGTPYCITVDNDTLSNQTVTLRERDSMKQERVEINNLLSIVKSKVDITELLRRL